MTAINFNAALDPVTMERVKQVVSASRGKCVAYFDIDGTLIDDDHLPNESVLSLLSYLHRSGARIYLWSAGGDEHCRDVAARYGIEAMISAYLPKPVISVDDLRYDDYVFLKLHPEDLSPKQG
jgi:predicted HAD superfamily phosphohydrolase YqeG